MDRESAELLSAAKAPWGVSGEGGPGAVDAEGAAKNEDVRAPPPAKLESKTESKVWASSAKPSRKASAIGSLRAAPSIIARMSESVLSARGPQHSRSAMSMPATAAASRASIVSRGSRLTTQSMPVDYGLSPELQQLIERLTNPKDVGLIAYLSAIPGEPHRASKPPGALARLQRKASARPKSIMKISKPQIRFEPTYRTEPQRPFRTDRARALLQHVLESGLEGAVYSEQWATDALRILAAYITQCMKGLEAQAPGSRYKIATMVSVVERNWQGVRAELAALWDADRDRFVTASVETSTMVASAVVYAVYWE